MTSACDGDVTLRLFEDGDASGGDDSSEPCQKLGIEVCNGGDDNCDGVIDEGCKYTVVWRAQADGALLGHAPGGVAFTERCPDGSILTGLRLTFGQWLNQVSAVCAQIGLTAANVDGAVNFSLALGPRLDRPLFPAVSEDPTNQMYDLSCPEGLVASALEGETDDTPARHIIAVGMRCARAIVSMQAPDTVFDLDRSQEQAVGPVTCATCSARPTYNFEDFIPPKQIAKRLVGAVSLSVDRFGLGGNTPTVTSR
jgi:hypothetical protein